MCLVWFLSSGRIQDSTEHCLLGQSINAFSVHGFAYCVMTQYLLNWCPQWSKMCWIFSPFRFFFLMKWVKITDTIQVFFFFVFFKQQPVKHSCHIILRMTILQFSWNNLFQTVILYLKWASYFAHLNDNLFDPSLEFSFCDLLEFWELNCIIFLISLCFGKVST